MRGTLNVVWGPEVGSALGRTKPERLLSDFPVPFWTLNMWKLNYLKKWCIYTLLLYLQSGGLMLAMLRECNRKIPDQDRDLNSQIITN